jgi:hypothetical protein
MYYYAGTMQFFKFLMSGVNKGQDRPQLVFIPANKENDFHFLVKDILSQTNLCNLP